MILNQRSLRLYQIPIHTMGTRFVFIILVLFTNLIYDKKNPSLISATSVLDENTTSNFFEFHHDCVIASVS